MKKTMITRVDEDIYNIILSEAERNKRSLSSEIAYMLESIIESKKDSEESSN